MANITVLDRVLGGHYTVEDVRDAATHQKATGFTGTAALLNRLADACGDSTAPHPHAKEPEHDRLQDARLTTARSLE